MSQPQSFKNHARVVPLFHYLAFPMVGLNLFWTTRRALLHPSADTVVAALFALAVVLLFFFARIFALTVQDRVIRLEMRLRLRELLPPALVARIPEFTRGQLVAMRFASDAELPALARKVLDERLHDKKAIKQLVKAWQADDLRA